MRRDNFSILFYVSNISGLTFGVYLVATYLMYRILVLYCLFNLILFWITTPSRRRLWTENTWNSRPVVSFVAISACALATIVLLCSSESLYSLPTFAPPLIAVAIVLLTIMAAVDGAGLDRPFFMKTWFLVSVITSLVLLVDFSIYLAQPSIFAQPTYATVDAYRDYINASRILIASGLRPGEMILQRYYAAFPIVPMQISAIGLVTGLPLNAAHMAMAVSLEAIGVVSVWLLSTTVVGEIEPPLARSAGVLTVVSVLLQPYLAAPTSLFAPIRFTIPFVTLILYLTYRYLTRSAPRRRSVVVLIIAFVIVVVPMHAVPSMLLVVYFLVGGFLVRQSRRPSISLAVISLVLLVTYLVSLAATPLTSLVFFARSTYAAIVEIVSGGPSIIAEAVLGSRINVQQTEPDLFMQALPLALVLSMSTSCIARCLRPLVQNSKGRRLSLLHAGYGILVVGGIGGGFLFSLFGVDMRYFAFPVTGLAAIACAVVLGCALRNASTSRIKGAILIGVMTLYAFSVVSSPATFRETDPNYVRMLSIESESAAARFVSRSVQAETGSPIQIVTDWPFYIHVVVRVYSSKIGIEDRVKYVQYSPVKGEETIVILRQYFLENLFLRDYVHAKILNDAERLNSYNRVSDSGTTRVYVGTFTG